MNTDRFPEGEPHRSLKILDEFSADGSLTQRELSKRLGIALGLANTYIKNLIAKGFITVKAIPPRRYAYYLTPKGFAEKTRLTFDLLHDYTRIYRDARGNIKNLFSELQSDGVRTVVFAGADEVAEIAYITLHETNMTLGGVVDNQLAGNRFFGREILRISDITSMQYDCIVITSYLKRKEIYRDLLDEKTPKADIKIIFTI